MRRPPPIAGLFTVLAAGLALIAVAAWGGGAQGARAGGRRARALDGGLALRLLVGPRRPPADDSRIQ